MHHHCEHEKRSVTAQTDSDRGAQVFFVCVKQVALTYCIADIRLLARLFYPLQPSNIRMVAVSGSDTSQHFLVAP